VGYLKNFRGLGMEIMKERENKKKRLAMPNRRSVGHTHYL
jgi:hypothetical protein